jgi:alpha-galactosidase
MKVRAGGLILLLLAAAALKTGAQSPAKSPSEALAARPPMGWNSWDGYGTTINEEQFKSNAKWMSEHLKAYGWEYAVIDMEWFVTNPTPEGNSKSSVYTLDRNGRYLPAANRFPSSAGGQGFRPISEYVHSLGLKFGIHILRGIPKKAVEANAPIAGSTYSATDAADRSETCPWNPDNYGAQAAEPASQAYYDSIAALYAGWGVDLIKVDCISSHPYRGDEIRMLSEALRKTGRPMVLSLSPGAAPIEKIDEMRKYAQMWRISDDIWDIWHSDVQYPQGLVDQFANILRWIGKSRPGAWPDADMLPIGYLGPAPGWGKPRQTRLTRDEQQMLMTMWAILPSPLMIGGDLTQADAQTKSLLTNREVLAMNQRSNGSRAAVVTGKIVVLLSESSEGKGTYVAVFNRGDELGDFRYSWKALGLPGSEYSLRDLWNHGEAGKKRELTGKLERHACLLYLLKEPE